MTESESHRHDLAIVQLGLQLGTGKELHGLKPTDEELAALIDNGLENRRRREVIGHIANHPTVYGRWLRLVELQEQMREMPVITSLSGKDATHTTRVWWAQQFFSNLAKMFTTPGALASAATGIAIVLVLVVFLVPMDHDVDYRRIFDQAYNKWPASLQEQWNHSDLAQMGPGLIPRGMGLLGKKSIYRQVVETGIRQGLQPFADQTSDSLGIDKKKLASVSYTNQPDLTRGQYEHLLDLGRISSMLMIQCKLDPNHANTQNIYPALRQLVNDIGVIANDEMNSLLVTFKNAKNKSSCLLANAILDLVSTQ